ncbi:hypothetical protein FRC10_012070 [Ceratobasidium sp. 414]|nr:hypothetical protein FRC10_012070 [Ceratobasidium sp. 414]
MHPELSSSQEFIRALKGSKDPPNDGGLPKVELARQAWELESLFIPSKAEVIVEWALQSLLAHSHARNPDKVILSDKLWKLLADIICTRMDFGGPVANTNSGPGWLNGVVNRVPVLPIFAALLCATAQIVPFTWPATPDDSLRLVFEAATGIARVLLPLASLKATCDTVASCFWEVLGIFSIPSAPEEALLLTLDLCELIVSTFETSFTNYSNKKKIASILVEKYQSTWLSSEEPRHSEPLSLAAFRHRLFDVGCSIIFCPEHTRVISQSAESHPILLAAVSSPQIFTAYVSGLRAHKLSVFLDQGAGASTGGLAKRIRGAARELFARLVTKCEWSAIAQITQSAEELQVVDDEWAHAFAALVEFAIQTLKRPWTDVDGIWQDDQAQVAVHVCSTLACILRLNIDVVQPHTEHLLTGLCTAPTLVLPAAGSVLELLLDHHSKARTLHTYLPQLTGSLTTNLKPREFYQAACTGPVLDAAHLAKLRRSVAAFITPGQILSCARQLLSEFATSIATVFSAEPPRKKRRILGGPNLDYIDEAAAAHIGLSSRLLVAILGSLPVKTLKPDALESLKGSVDEFDAGALSSALASGLERDLWARQTSLAAVLRVQYCLRQPRCPVRAGSAPTAEEDDLLLDLVQDAAVSAELVTEAVRVLTLGQRPQDHLRNVWSLALGRLQADCASQRDATWNGSLAHLDKHVWFPLWFLLLDRQLDVVESTLGPDQLKSILCMFATLSRGPKIPDTISSIQLFTKAISSARFWEMPNLRRALNEMAASDTLPLDQTTLHKALKAMRKGKAARPAAGSHEAAILTYHLAALCPPDYLDRSVKAALLARAPCADVLAADPRDRAAVRLVLRQLSLGGTLALPEEYVRYLLDPLQHRGGPSDDSHCVDDTLAILKASFRLAKDTGSQGDLGAVLQNVATLALFSAPLWGSPPASLPIRATLHLLDIIPEIWGSRSTLPEEIPACMVRLLNQIRNCVEQSDVVTDMLIEAARTLASCAPPAPCRARRLLRALPQGNSVATEALIRLITEEVRNSGEDARLLLAAFAFYARSHNAGTSKARRRSTTVILHTLAQLPQTQAPQEACAALVAEICSERASALTVPDMTAIWILLDRATTSTDEIFLGVYSALVTSLSSLIRFRRDLLTPALAQLSALLARLIRTLRLRTSHAIGAPQRSAEAQASLAGKATELARLLVGLTTKNAPVIVRSKMEQKQTTKVESLARPFARHAPYLLVAYTGSAAEMGLAVRTALKPGLFALCEMSGAPARDMIMVTMLDTVEKEIFGAVWREWEAQKYTGKG